MNLKKELARLRRMTAKDLRARYAEVFGEQTRSCNKPYLIKRIAWRLQANEEGGLSERAKRRAEQLAAESDVRLMPPPEVPGARNGHAPASDIPADRDPRLPEPGTVLTRAYKGATLHVTVLDDGFEHAGERYRTLSAVAKAITGSHCSGFAFFKVGSHAR